MSWQRILRFAKQRQVPVIITDESGEEPMILLSLDALEQALDGVGTGPDLPPVPPTPKSTTPSFVPQMYEEEPSFISAQPVPSSESEPEPTVISEDIPPIETASEEPVAEIPPVVLKDGDSASVSEPRSETLPESDPIVINDFESPAPTSEPQYPDIRATNVEIMTPPQIRPEPLPLTASEKKEETEPSIPISESESSAPKGISLEERFFLDF